MQHIGNLLSKRIKQSGFSQQVKTSLIINEFNKVIKEVFGAEISKKIKPLYIKNGVLTAACLSSVMAQEINFKKAEIIETINKKFKENVLQEIKFTL
jgi:predicted nucleic acid-binding Zn ribbon protein